jgi:hypothetical protein
MIIGLGELNLNPEEMYEYSLQEFTWKLEGVRKIENMNYRDNWERTREIMYMTAQMAGKTAKQGLTKYHIAKFPWDKEQPKSKIADLPPEERRAAAQQIIDRANEAFQNYLNSKN